MTAPTLVDETDIFADIFLPEPVPSMPERLQRFDVQINNAIARAEADLVFIAWLRGHLTRTPIKLSDEAAACNDAELRNLFFPEWPFEEEFQSRDESGGLVRESEWRSFAFRRQYAQAEIDTAEARATCAECPLRTKCLTRSIDSATQERHGVWGGWGAGPRKKIANKFNEIRRRYLRGVRSLEKGLGKKKWKGMSREQIVDYEARALAG